MARNRVMIIQDIYTGKRYINNIPEGELAKIINQWGDRYTIVAKSTGEPYPAWYKKTWKDGQFQGDEYAVYCLAVGDNRYYRVSDWYKAFDRAKRKMLDLSKRKST